MSIVTDIGDTLVDSSRPARQAKKRNKSLVSRVVGRLSRPATRRMTVAIFGSMSSCTSIVWQCLQQAGRGLEIAGVFLDNDEAPVSGGYCLGCSVVGNLEDLLVMAQTRQIDAVILAIPRSADRRIQNVVARLRQIAIDVYLQDDEARGVVVSHAALHELPITLIERRPLTKREVFLKAVEDRVLAAAILTMISPLLLLIAAMIKLDSPGPVIFRQKRYGLNNRLIEIYKFRTLHVSEADTNAEQLVTRNDSRVTRVGAFLRRTSLDELPQFLNVLRGDMSVVGPRPHALSAKAGILQYDEIIAEYPARHRVKPGITGWAQINGWRGETTKAEHIEQRVAHDFFYIANWSLLLDLKIVLKTVTGGFGGRQAY